MTKFEEEVKRPANGPLTELNNNMQEVFSQYRKMRQYADYLEYELKQKDEYVLKLENENSFMRDERTTFDSNGMAVEPKLQQQPLPEVPEFVAERIESIPRYYSAFGAMPLVKNKFEKRPEDNEDWMYLYNWLFDSENEKNNQDLFVRAWPDGYTVQKPQLFYIELPNVYGLKNKIFVSKVENRTIVEFSNGKNYALKFTEQEIKSIDERYWQFAVPVEDGK